MISVWMILVLLYTGLLVCGIGFAWYVWGERQQPSGWFGHVRQWWWSYGGMGLIYSFRFLPFDTVFRGIGEGVGIMGICVVGYVIGYAFYRL